MDPQLDLRGLWRDISRPGIIFIRVEIHRTTTGASAYTLMLETTRPTLLRSWGPKTPVTGREFGKRTSLGRTAANTETWKIGTST